MFRECLRGAESDRYLVYFWGHMPHNTAKDDGDKAIKNILIQQIWQLMLQETPQLLYAVRWSWLELALLAQVHYQDVLLEALRSVQQVLHQSTTNRQLKRLPRWYPTG